MSSDKIELGPFLSRGRIETSHGVQLSNSNSVPIKSKKGITDHSSVLSEKARADTHMEANGDGAALTSGFMLLRRLLPCLQHLPTAGCACRPLSISN